MKSVIALALAGAVAAIPAGWNDAAVSTTTTTKPAEVTKTWEDVKSTTTTASVDPKTWEDVVSSTTVDPKTWEDVVSSTTVDPKTWEDVVSSTATTSSHWADYSVPVTETITTLTAITTYCPYATKFTDKGDVYTVTEATTLTLTKGPYTVTIPIYEETSTVCDEPAGPTGAASTWADVPAPAGPTDAASTWVDAAVPTGASPVSPVAPKEPVSPYTGSASKMAGAGLAGVAAVAALLL